MFTIEDKVTSLAVGVASKLVRWVPNFSRRTLSHLLDHYPDTYRSIVPQGIDGQTGLYSKRYFEDTLLPRIIHHASEHEIPISYALIDIDDLKKINDQYGHDGGDAAIRMLAEIIKSNFRTHVRRGKKSLAHFESILKTRRGNDRRKYQGIDVAAHGIDVTPSYQGRVGYGDEFAIILYGCTQEQAFSIMSRFLDQLKSQRIEIGEIRIPISVSVGISQYEQGIKAEDLIKRSDSALYTIKKGGKSAVGVYTR